MTVSGQFILVPVKSQRWMLKDNNQVELHYDGWDNVVVYDYGGQLQERGFPIETQLMTTIRQTAQEVAALLDCSPSLRQRDPAYEIGKTGFTVQKTMYLDGTFLWGIQSWPYFYRRRDIRVAQQLPEAPSFATRDAAVTWFQAMYADYRRPRISRWFNKHPQSYQSQNNLS